MIIRCVEWKLLNMMNEELRKKISEATKKAMQNPLVKEKQKLGLFIANQKEEVKINRRNCKLGNKNPMFGKSLSEEHKAKIGLAHRGNKSNFFGKFGPYHPSYKHGKTNNNKCIDCIKKISSKATRCSSCDKKYRFKNNLNFVLKQNQSKKLRWKNKEYREKTLIAQRKGRIIYKNKAEQKLELLLSDKYKFVGDWSFVIDGFCPDFINQTDKKIIELFGKYWHDKRPDIDIRRLKAYSEAGYKTLIVWDYELKDINKLKNKINEFNNE